MGADGKKAELGQGGEGWGGVERDGAGASFGLTPRCSAGGAERLRCSPAWGRVMEECGGPCAPGEDWGARRSWRRCPTILTPPTLAPPE